MTPSEPTSLSLDCPCGAHLRAPAASAGKRVKCPKCGATLPVPGSAVPPPATPEADPWYQLAPAEPPPATGAASVPPCFPGSPAPSMGPVAVVDAAPTISGLAIASLICGTAGLGTCCAFIPSILGIVFGLVSLGPIKAGARRGGGLAIAGVILGALGLLVGAMFWIWAIRTPSPDPLTGHEVSAADRRFLESVGALDPNEELQLFYSGGIFSIREGGVLITAKRLVVYREGRPVDSYPLADIGTIQFTPGRSRFDDGHFVIATDAGKLATFQVSSSGETVFEQVLRLQVEAARRAVGRPVPQADVGTTPEAD